jgi:hypothetical protein
MKMLRYIALFIMILLVACKTAEPRFDSKMNQLNLGMAPEAVSQILGAPELREASEDKEKWLYNLREPLAEQRFVLFTGGKVSAFGRTQSVTAPQAVPTLEKSDQLNPNSTPRPIGEACKEDQECESQNCHFKRCSGKNNCSVPEGRVCGDDNQCCTGFCNFGICRKK